MTTPPMDAQSLYVQLGRLIETMPDLYMVGPVEPVMRWLARGRVLVDQISFAEGQGFAQHAQNLFNSNRHQAATGIQLIVHHALAVAEASAPLSARGSFIAAGNVLDAMAAVGRVVGTATRDVLIVDPYMDEKALTDFAALAPEKVMMRVLADQSKYKPTLSPARERWITQYGAARPLEVRITAPGALHDRLIVVDETVVWSVTQSLKDFATRAHGAIVRVEDSEVSALKIDAYTSLWKSATPLA
jgi:hypothetical protein